MTINLVKNPTKKLSEKQTEELLAQVQSWEKADKAFFQEMLDSQRQLKGEQWPVEGAAKTSENQVTANLAFAMFKGSLPYIFFKEPTARTRPKNPLQVGKEAVWDGILNATMPLIDYAKQKRMQIEDAWLYSEGWSKWVISPDDGDTQGQGKTQLTEVPKGPAKWHGKGLPVSLRLTPRQVIVDSEARGRDPDEARAIFIKYRRPLNEVLADPRYDIDKKRFLMSQNKDAAKAKPGGEFGNVMRARLDDFFDSSNGSVSGATSDEVTVTIWEGWVYQLVDYKLRRQVVTLMEDYPVPIMQPQPWEAFVGENFPGWPIRKIEFNRIPDDRPTNNIKITQNLQGVFNWLLTKLVNHVDTLNTVRTVNNGALKDPKKTMRQLRKGKSLEYVEVQEPGAIENVPTPPFPGDAYNLLGIVEGLIDRIGPGSQNRGGQLDARTATEANIVEQSLRTLDDDNVDVVKKFLVEDLEQLSQMLLRVLSTEQVLKIVGDTGGIEFGSTDTDVLSSIPDVEIEVDSFRKVSKQEKLQPWSTIWSLAIQAFQLGMTDIRLDVVIGRIAQALDIDPGLIVGNLEDERLAEMFDILTTVQAAAEGMDPLEAVPIPEDANPAVRLQIVEFFLASETAKRMGQGALAAIEQRHMALLQMVDEVRNGITESQSAGNQASFGQNPFDQGGQNGSDPATQARSQTQQQLQQGGLQPGTRGTPT